MFWTDDSLPKVKLFYLNTKTFFQKNPAAAWLLSVNSKGYLEGQFHEKLIIVFQKWYLEEQFYEKIELSIKSVI